MNRLEQGEIIQVYNVISDELKYTDSDEDIRTILQVMPEELWGYVDRAVRIRIENILYKSVENTYSVCKRPSVVESI